MTLYTIRHANGVYLPARALGLSWWEGQPHNRLPRLFKTLGQAKGWRTTWLKGRVVKTYVEQTGAPWDQIDGVEMRLDYEPRPNRKLTDLQILPVSLSIGDPL